MSTNKIQFVKQFKRESKSPFDDCSTNLLLADVIYEENEELRLDYIEEIKDFCNF